MIIQGSIFGAIADPNQWGEFSCIKKDGTLDIELFSNYMRKFANMGCNSTREIPYLVTDKNYKSSAKQRNFLPFVFKDNKYDLSKLNQVYFDNLKEMIKAVHRHNMSYQVVFFDRCHGLQKDSPWKLNRQGIKDWYDWNVYAKGYAIKVLDTLKELKKEIPNVDLLIELENEPHVDGFCKSGIETLKLLKKYGYKDNQIELGVSYIPNKIEFNENGSLKLGHLFEKFKKAMRKSDPPLYDGTQKADYLSTIHDFGNNSKKVDEICKAVTHTRRLSLSNDGQKPKADKAWWYNTLEPIFETMKSSKLGMKNQKLWKFEALYRGKLNGTSSLGDKIDGISGLSEVYKKVFGIYPANYGKFPKTILPEEIEDMGKIKELEKEIVELKAIILNDNKTLKELRSEIETIKEVNNWKFFKSWKSWDFTGLLQRHKWLILSHILVFILGIIIF